MDGGADDSTGISGPTVGWGDISYKGEGWLLYGGATYIGTLYL